MNERMTNAIATEAALLAAINFDKTLKDLGGTRVDYEEDKEFQRKVLVESAIRSLQETLGLDEDIVREAAEEAMEGTEYESAFWGDDDEDDEEDEYEARTECSLQSECNDCPRFEKCFAEIDDDDSEDECHEEIIVTSHSDDPSEHFDVSIQYRKDMEEGKIPHVLAEALVQSMSVFAGDDDDCEEFRNEINDALLRQGMRSLNKLLSDMAGEDA